jgi:hypothetical protein
MKSNKLAEGQKMGQDFVAFPPWIQLNGEEGREKRRVKIN